MKFEAASKKHFNKLVRRYSHKLALRALGIKPHFRKGQWVRARHDNWSNPYRGEIGQVEYVRRGLVMVDYVGGSFASYEGNLLPVTRQERAIAIAEKVLEL